MTAAIEILRPGPAARFAAELSGHVPTLSIAGGMLRAPRLSDFNTYAGIMCTARGQYMDGPMSRAGAWADFTNYTALWLLHGVGLWSIDTGQDAPAGFVLLGMEWNDPEPELGIFLTAAGEGRGLAQAACVAVRDHAFDGLGWNTLVSFVDPANARCIALMTRLGATRDAALEDRLADGTLAFRHNAPMETA